MGSEMPTDRQKQKKRLLKIESELGPELLRLLPIVVVPVVGQVGVRIAERQRPLRPKVEE